MRSSSKEVWLLNAINQNNLQSVKMLLRDKSINLLTITIATMTPLAIAILWSYDKSNLDEKASQTNLAIIDQLLDAKADPNYVDVKGHTPLMYALESYEIHGRNQLMIKKLIDKGASLDHCSVNFNEFATFGFGILIRAIINKDLFLVDILLKLKGKYPIDVEVPDKTNKWPPIQWAASLGDEDIFNLIAAKLSSKTVEQYRPILHKTIFTHAIQRSDIKAVQKCIEQDQKILNAPLLGSLTSCSLTPLELAFKEKKEAVFNHLLTAGADPNFLINKKPVLELILDKKIDPSQSRMLIKLLSHEKVNVNLMVEGRSLLYKLMEIEDSVFFSAYLKRLIKRGAQCLPYELPLHVTLDKNPSKLITLMNSNHFNVDQPDEKGNTFLHKMLTLKFSAEYKKQIIDIYCQKGDLEKTNHSGETYLIKAILSKDIEVIKHLISKGSQYQTKEVLKAILEINTPEISKYFSDLIFIDEKKLNMPSVFQNVKKFVEKEQKYLMEEERNKIQQRLIELARECLVIFEKDRNSEDPILKLKETLSELRKCLMHESLSIRLQTYFEKSQQIEKYFIFIEQQAKEIAAELGKLSDNEAHLMLEAGIEKGKSVKLKLASEHKESENKLLFDEYIKKIKYYKNELKNFNKELNIIFRQTQDEKVLKTCRILEGKLIKNYLVKISDNVPHAELDAAIKKLEMNGNKIKELSDALVKERAKLKPIKIFTPVISVKEKKKEKVKEPKLKTQKEHFFPSPVKNKEEDKSPPSTAFATLRPHSIFTPTKQSLEDEHLLKTLSVGNALFTRYQWDTKNILNEVKSLKNEEEQFKKIFDISVLLKTLFLSFTCKYFSNDTRLRNKTLYYLEHIVKAHDVSLSVLHENFGKLLEAVQDCHYAIETTSGKLSSALAKQIKESHFAINDQKGMEKFERLDFADRAAKLKKDIHSISTSPYLNKIEKEYLKTSLTALQDAFLQKSGVKISHQRRQNAVSIRH